ncbi:hypothetical protein NG798_26505 [Ancylothrix sp. C2]|uniref:hypothetical protein n=1 Tax=Ancylothrix sp. D3o TaxID=2953691 RepID=UPI0021BB4125|nr:hypothetical protein [Ancylothrix sp. D3o]MCT7953355.1 hypothetical protein [Ancylothrix sp. D3o]
MRTRTCPSIGELETEPNLYSPGMESLNSELKSRLGCTGTDGCDEAVKMDGQAGIWIHRHRWM